MLRRAARAALGFLAGLVARAWLATLRLEVQIHPALGELAGSPWVLAFLHGKQWPLLAWRGRRPTGVLVSLSADGEVQARALSLLGLTVVRGSSSRGGARGLAGVVRLLRRDHDAAFAVDGPRGPYGVAKPGVLLAARRGRGVVVPAGTAVACGKVLHRAWDRFTLAWPFTRVAVVLGAPVFVRGEGTSLEEDLARVGDAISAANEAAQAILASAERGVVRFSKG